MAESCAIVSPDATHPALHICKPGLQHCKVSRVATHCATCNDIGMKIPNPFAEFVVAVGSVSKAAKVLGIEKTRIWRLSKGSVPVRFEELDRVRIALDAISVSRNEMSRTHE